MRAFFKDSRKDYNMSKLKNDMIRNLKEQKSNCFSSENDLIGNFVERAAKELNKRTRVDGKKIEFYHGKDTYGSINGLLPGSTGKLAYAICKDKFKTEKFLNLMNLPTLKSRFFTFDQIEEAFEFLEQNNKETFVLKPLSLGSGKGIIFNVNKDNFEEAYKESLNVQTLREIETPSFILQSYLDGFDVRICIVEGKYSCALWRVQPHVVGDGINTIVELIQEKNEARKKSVYFQRFLYEINEELIRFLKQQNKNLESVLEVGEVIFLSNLGNLAAGAESVDVTKEISKDLIDIALRSVASVPGLHTAGVDILTDNFNSKTGYIIEINTNANHKVHYLPYYGTVRKPYQNMIENMFIKYKVNFGYGLTQQERRIYREIAVFNKYKEMYHNKLGNEVF